MRKNGQLLCLSFFFSSDICVWFQTTIYRFTVQTVWGSTTFPRKSQVLGLLPKMFFKNTRNITTKMEGEEFPGGTTSVGRTLAMKAPPLHSDRKLLQKWVKWILLTIRQTTCCTVVSSLFPSKVDYVLMEQRTTVLRCLRIAPVCACYHGRTDNNHFNKIKNRI